MSSIFMKTNVASSKNLHFNRPRKIFIGVIYSFYFQLNFTHFLLVSLEKLNITLNTENYHHSIIYMIKINHLQL